MKFALTRSLKERERRAFVNLNEGRPTSGGRSGFEVATVNPRFDPWRFDMKHLKSLGRRQSLLQVGPPKTYVVNASPEIGDRLVKISHENPNVKKWFHLNIPSSPWFPMFSELAAACWHLWRTRLACPRRKAWRRRGSVAFRTCLGRVRSISLFLQFEGSFVGSNKYRRPLGAPPVHRAMEKPPTGRVHFLSNLPLLCCGAQTSPKRRRGEVARISLEGKAACAVGIDMSVTDGSDTVQRVD
jgi:hypothetical protein